MSELEKCFFQSESYWSDVWVRHIEAYIAAPPRCGYWLGSFFPRSMTVLEIAGGSCRDSRYLATLGFDAIGSDFDQKTLDYLEKRHPNSLLPMRCENAFALSLADKSVDMSYSNGFWIYFLNDEKIYSLIHEQARVTRKYLVSLVHNVENRILVNQFERKAKLDSLYDIRFFHRNQLLDILKKSGLKYKSVSFRKFGGPMDRFLAIKIMGAPNPFHGIARYIVPRMYKLQPWSMTERIACVIELE